MIVVRLPRGGDVPAAIHALVRPPLDLHDGAWEAEAFWSESISLVLVGAMIFSSVRGFPTQASRSMSSLTSHIQEDGASPTYRTCMRRTTSSCMSSRMCRASTSCRSCSWCVHRCLPRTAEGCQKRASVASSGVSTTRGSTCSFSPQLLRPSPFLPSRGTSTWDTAGFHHAGLEAAT